MSEPKTLRQLTKDWPTTPDFNAARKRFDDIEVENMKLRAELADVKAERDTAISELGSVSAAVDGVKTLDIRHTVACKVSDLATERDAARDACAAKDEKVDALTAGNAGLVEALKEARASCAASTAGNHCYRCFEITKALTTHGAPGAEMLEELEGLRSHAKGLEGVVDTLNRVIGSRDKERDAANEEAGRLRGLVDRAHGFDMGDGYEINLESDPITPSVDCYLVSFKSGDGIRGIRADGSDVEGAGDDFADLDDALKALSAARTEQATECSPNCNGGVVTVAGVSIDEVYDCPDRTTETDEPATDRLNMSLDLQTGEFEAKAAARTEPAADSQGVEDSAGDGDS